MSKIPNMVAENILKHISKANASICKYGDTMDSDLLSDIQNEIEELQSNIDEIEEWDENWRDNL